jgi:X-X-X-Leu-X-X-Gly heptad repeat protein
MRSIRQGIRAAGLLGIALALLLGVVPAAATASPAPPADAAATPELATPAALSALDEDGTGSGDAEVKSKNEVIYALLDAGGAVHEAYVVNSFSVARGGGFKDYGPYSSVENLTNIEPIISNGDEHSLVAAKGEFYYQGTLQDPVLPWQITLSYTLDGEKLAPAELASLGGRSGRLGISLATSSTEGFADLSFYAHYTLQISLTLPSANISNLSAEGATVVAAGSDTQVNYVVLPDSSESYDFAVDFENIHMPGISIAAVPYGMSFELPDTSGISDELSSLVSAINALHVSTAQINAGLGQGVSGLEQLARGSDLYNTGLIQLNAGSATLRESSATLNTNLAATIGGLQDMAGRGAFLSLSPADQQLLMTYLYTLAALLQGSAQLDGGLQAYTAGVEELAGQYPSINNGIAQSAQGMSQLSSGLSQLNSGVGQLSGGVANMPEEMQTRIDEFAASYDFSGFEPHSFLSPQNSKVALVQFVIATPAIELPKEPEDEGAVQEESSLLDKLMALFTGE